jgi:hypothetical protein
MQRIVLSSFIAFLAACASQAATSPVVSDAPSLAEADPMQRYRTELTQESLVDPPQLRTDLIGPLATTTTPSATASGDATAPEPVATPDGLAGLTGDYRYRSGRASAAKSIDGVVGKMSALVRNIARDRLTKANRVPNKVAIAQVGDEVTVRMDGRAYTATLGGAARKVKDANGEASRMRFQLRGDALYQLLDADDGDRTNVFTKREDGGIDMAVRISSKRLPQDVRYKVSYKPAE